MAKGFRHGGVGIDSLNFAVVAYATEEELLADTPKENTIGVITDHEITAYSFSATEPAEPIQGMVWVSVGVSSPVEFNALKKNAIQVYPGLAKQYVSGAWVDVSAKTYQDGAWRIWADPTMYLIKNGVPVSEIKTVNINVYEQDGYIELGSSATGYKAGYILADLTNYNTLVVEGTFSGFGSDTYQLCVWDKNTASPAYDNDIAGADLTDKNGELDISSLSGEYYVGITTVYNNRQHIVNLYMKI